MESFTQGNQQLVVHLHHVSVELLLLPVQQTPLLLSEVYGHILKRCRELSKHPGILQLLIVRRLLQDTAALFSPLLE